MLNIKNILLTSVLSLSLCSVASASVIADLSERDWMVGGDSSLTYDASTNLEWLDLTVTAGNSILDTEATSLFGEFRWATASEINNILDAALDGTGSRGSSLAIDIDNTVSFVNLFGVTSLGNPNAQIHVQGVSRGSESATPNTYGLGYASTNFTSVTVADPLINCCWAETTKTSTVGSWLVRDATSVPEPTTILLMGLGLVGFSLARRKTAVK